MIISRDERQLQCIKRWRKNNGIGTVCACTGFGIHKNLLYYRYFLIFVFYKTGIIWI